MTYDPCEHCSSDLPCDCADDLETEAWRADIAPREPLPRAFSPFGFQVLGLTREDLS